MGLTLKFPIGFPTPPLPLRPSRSLKLSAVEGLLVELKCPKLDLPLTGEDKRAGESRPPIPPFATGVTLPVRLRGWGVADVLRLSPCPVLDNGMMGTGDIILLDPPPVGVRLRDANAEDDDGCGVLKPEGDFISGVVDGGGGVRLPEVVVSRKADDGAGERRRAGPGSAESFGRAATRTGKGP